MTASIAPVKALTVRQPYADAIMRQWKRYEIRTQRTKYRGEFVVHSAKVRIPTNVALEIIYAQAGVSLDSLAYGCGLGVARVVDCVPYSELVLSDRERVLCPPWGLWAYALEVVEVWETPVPAKGQLGFWRWVA